MLEGKRRGTPARGFVCPLPAEVEAEAAVAAEHDLDDLAALLLPRVAHVEYHLRSHGRAISPHASSAARGDSRCSALPSAGSCRPWSGCQTRPSHCRSPAARDGILPQNAVQITTEIPTWPPAGPLMRAVTPRRRGRWSKTNGILPSLTITLFRDQPAGHPGQGRGSMGRGSGSQRGADPPGHADPDHSLWAKDERGVDKDGIVVRDREVVHHDRIRDGDEPPADDIALQERAPEVQP